MRVREGGVEQFALGYKKFGSQPLLNSDIRSLVRWSWALGLAAATYLNISTPPIPVR